MAIEQYDFSGYATRNGIRCTDGRSIKKNAFVGNDGQRVPLVYNHEHGDINKVLGHAILENREDGVYAYCSFNDTEAGKTAKELVKHGDVRSLSIYANNLKEMGKDVIHGVIRELSLVLAGANPGAFIDEVMLHSDDSTASMIVGYDEPIELYHSAIVEPEVTEPVITEPVIEHAATGAEGATEKTLEEVVNTMSEEQQNAMYALIGITVEDIIKNGEGDSNMKHNLFENEGSTKEDAALMHTAMAVILGDGKKYGSLKDSYLAHAEEYGITNIDYMFPDATLLDAAPQWIKRQTEWVQVVIGGTRHVPFSKIKSMFADITADEARAKGYIKGNFKEEEVFTLLKRETGPTTIFKKQKLDRDDVVDIVSFDVVAWLKTEMRMMLDEEIARAILIGDGRLGSSNDKIKEDCIRPIWKDEALFTIKTAVEVAANDTDAIKANNFIDTVIRSRKAYRGSGTPTCFTTEDILTECLLLKDTTGRRLYSSVAELATTLRVDKIVTVEVMENQTRLDANTRTYTLMALLVNLSDYSVGADKGGAVNMFDDFDIDYNQQKYLIETRCSGALTKPFSAIAVESVPAIVG